MRTITMLIGEQQAAQIAALRARDPQTDEATFWAILIADGAAVYGFQLAQAEQDTDNPDYPNDALPEAPGPAEPRQIAVDEDQAAVLDALRARRPEMDEARFWQLAIEWGVGILAQMFDAEDRAARGEGDPDPAPDEDGIPF